MEKIKRKGKELNFPQQKKTKPNEEQTKTKLSTDYVKKCIEIKNKIQSKLKSQNLNVVVLEILQELEKILESFQLNKHLLERISNKIAEFLEEQSELEDETLEFFEDLYENSKISSLPSSLSDSNKSSVSARIENRYTNDYFLDFISTFFSKDEEDSVSKELENLACSIQKFEGFEGANKIKGLDGLSDQERERKLQGGDSYWEKILLSKYGIEKGKNTKKAKIKLLKDLKELKNKVDMSGIDFIQKEEKD